MWGKSAGGSGQDVVGEDLRRATNSFPPSSHIWGMLESLEDRLLLSASTVGGEPIEPVSASGVEVVANAVSNDVVYQEQTQVDNFFKPNIITFDFPIDPSAINGRIDITALSDLDGLGETVTYDIEGIVGGDLWTAADDGVRPFSATIDLADIDLAAIAADGNLHVEFTPSSGVDDFANVDEYVTVGLTYEVEPPRVDLSLVSQAISGAYSGVVTGDIAEPGGVNEHLIDLEAGQTLCIEGVPDFNLAMSVQVLNPTGAVVQTVEGIAGERILLQPIALTMDGTYSLRVASDGVSQGVYDLNIYVNLGVELESIGGATNDDFNSAQNLDDLFRDLGLGAEQAAILGNASTRTIERPAEGNYRITTSFDDAVIPPGWTIQTSGSGSYRFEDSFNGIDPYTLVMESQGTEEGLTEAIWTVPINPLAELQVISSRMQQYDSYEKLPETFSGSYNGDGLSYSADGVNWFNKPWPVNFEDGLWTGVYSWPSRQAESLGIDLGDTIYIKLQHYNPPGTVSGIRAYDNISVNYIPTEQVESPIPDRYSFTLEANEFVSIQYNGLEDYDALITLYDPNHEEVDRAFDNYAEGAKVIDFNALDAGTYTIEVSEGSGKYLLSVVKGATIENETLSQNLGYTQRLDRTGLVVGSHSTAHNLGVADYYSIPVSMGDNLIFETITPNDGASGLNLSDPVLALYAPDGTQVAFDDNGSGDGRNARLTHTATQAGEYIIHISGDRSVYLLSASGYTGQSAPLFMPTNSNYSDGQEFTSRLSPIWFYMSDTILGTSLDVTDLTLNGQPAERIVYSLSNSKRVTFYLPVDAFIQGQNTIEVAAGAFSSRHGDLVEPIVINFTLDSIPPHVVASSISEGDILSTGVVDIDLQFNESIYAYGLEGGYHGFLYRMGRPPSVLNESYDASNFIYSESYDITEEGLYIYWFRARSGDSILRDDIGFEFDGEPSATTTPSGDGEPGGDFYVQFGVEDGAITPLTLEPVSTGPLQGFAYETTFEDTPEFVGDTERYTMSLEAGQRITIHLDNTPGFVESDIELLDPSGQVVAAGTGPDALINNLVVDQTGTYTLRVITTLVKPLYDPHDYTGHILPISHTGHILVNAVREVEEHGDPSLTNNDDLFNAQDLDAAFFALGDGVEQVTVFGSQPEADGSIFESFESGVLGPDWETYAQGARDHSRIEVTTAAGAADGSYALIMDSNTDSGYLVLNQATWTVDLTDFVEADLSFSHAEWRDEGRALPDTFQTIYNGDGVAISADGINWYTLLSAPDTPSYTWQDFSFSLDEVAAEAGIVLGQKFKIRFQQYGTDSRPNDGRGYDNIRITGTRRPEALGPDVYRLTLNAGEELSVMLDGKIDPANLELIGPDGQTIFHGSDTWADDATAIRGFFAIESGVYYIRVCDVDGPYSLIATRGAAVTPVIDPAWAPVDLGLNGKAVGAFHQTDTADEHAYRFYVNAGDDLAVWTTTPDFGLPTPANKLDTYLELYAPDGSLVAESGTGGEGLNALINHVAGQSGIFTIKLHGVNTLPDSPDGLEGGYILHVTGNTGSPPSLQVSVSSLNQGQVYTTEPTELTVHFSDVIRLDTLQASDLLVNGVAADSVGIIDNNTATFLLPAGVGQGDIDFAMAAGSVLGANGAPLEPFGLQVFVDSIAPRIIDVSINEGEIVETGEVSLTITFDQAIVTDDLTQNSVVLYGPGQYPRVEFDQFEYDPQTYTLSMTFQAEVEGLYLATFYDSYFRDSAGNQLDGEAPDGPIPPGVSGDGVPGGSFNLSINVDHIAPVVIDPVDRVAPLGSFVATTGTQTGVLNTPRDTDTYQVYIQTGQTITASLRAPGVASSLLYLDGPNGTEVGMSEQDVPIILTYTHTGPDGLIDLTIWADQPTANYEFTVDFNTIPEQSLPVLPGASEPIYDLSNSWLYLGDGSVSTTTIRAISQMADPGMPEPAYDSYAIELEAGQTLNAVAESDAEGLLLELIDAATGLPVATSGESSMYDSATLGFVSADNGRYILRVSSPIAADYQLTLQRGAAFDFESSDTSADPLTSLDESGAAIGVLQTPGPARLFAMPYFGSQGSAIVYELDPDTLQVINTVLTEAPYSLSALAYDGVYLYGTYIEPTGIRVINPDTGDLIRTIAPPGSYSGRALATYNNQVVLLQGELMTFLDPESGEVVRQLSVDFDMLSDAFIAGAESRGTIFVATFLSGASDARVVYEVDAETGQTVNTFGQLSASLSGIAYQDGKVYTFIDQYTMEVYDPDTWQLLGTYQIDSKNSRYGFRAIGGDDVLPNLPVDRYELTVDAGEYVTLSTETPFDHPAGMPLNDLDPMLRLFDPSGAEVAYDSNGASDGKNAVLSFTAVVGGVYTIEVSAASGSGEYLLNVDRTSSLTGDLDGDGFVGLADLDILLGNWNQSVPAGDLARGDASGDGFVGLDDLDLLLGNWNAGVPPVAQAFSASASETVESESVSSAIVSPNVKTDRRSLGSRSGNDVADRHQRETHGPAVATAWNDLNRRSDRAADAGYLPWSLQQQEESSVLGLWEEQE